MTFLKGLAPVLVLTLLFAGCADGPLLKYQFEKGQKSHYVFTTIAATKTAMGDTSMEIIFDVTQEVTEVTPDGAAKLTFTYARARMKSNNPMAGGLAEYDSQAENAEQQAGNPAVISAVAMKGAVITLTQHPDGSISDLSGMEGVLTKVLAGVGDGPERDMAEGMLKGTLSNKAWLKSLESTGVVFPEEDPEKITTWSENRTIEMPMLGEIGLTTTYTYEGSEAKADTTIANFTYVSKLDIEGFKPPEPDPANPMSQFLASLKITGGEITGKLSFDMGAGRMLKNENDLQLKMVLEMMGMEMENQTKTTRELVH